MATLENLTLALFNGVTWGVIIALLALGLNLIFGLLEVVNIAHGALYMAGAAFGWFIVQTTGSFYFALLLAPIVVGILGILIERYVLRTIEDDMASTLLVTFGLTFIIQELGLLALGPGTKSVRAPITGSFELGPISYSRYRIVIAVIAVIVMVALYVMLHRTRYGLWMRGVRQDRETAESMGIPTSRVYMLTFGLGSYFAAVAGVLIAPVIGVNHLMGLNILATAFIVVIVGGLGSLRGVLVASLLYALLENVGTVVLVPLQAQILALGIMTLLMLVLPAGIEGFLERLSTTRVRRS